jgi:three-Cys-motif partner protein
MSLLWPLEAHTEAKHRLYRRYLDAWWPIMLQQAWVEHVTYIEAFAGPGEYEGGEPGSPIYAMRSLLNHSQRSNMNIRRDRVTVIFMEKRKRRAAHLEQLIVNEFGPLDQLPCDVKVAAGADANSDVARLLTEAGAWGHPILAVLDSWSNVVVPFDDVARIGANRSSEVIVTFGPNWFQRRNELNQDLIDRVFGKRERWARPHRGGSTFDAWQSWLTAYRDALADAGFKHRLAFEVRPATGTPLYLVYGTGNARGVEVFKDAMWLVDRRDGMAYRDPRCSTALPDEEQLALFGGAADDERVSPELRYLVSQRIKLSPLTLDALRDWVLLATAQWRPKDARAAVVELHQDRHVGYRPEGRLNGRTELFWIS